MGRIGLLFYMVSECVHKLVLQDFMIVTWVGMRKDKKNEEEEEKRKKIESGNHNKRDTHSLHNGRVEAGSEESPKGLAGWGICEGPQWKLFSLLELGTDCYYFFISVL